MKRFLFLTGICLLALTTQAQHGTVDYKMTMGGGEKTMTSSNKMSFSEGNIRMDMNIPIPGMDKPMKQTMLIKADKPQVVYMLNEMSRTYTETPGDQSKERSFPVTVKVIGKEKILNLNTTHVLVTFEKGSMDMWTTREIPGYEKMMSYWRANKSMGGNNMFDELKKKGADGFIVRFKNAASAGGVTMELVSYDLKPVAANLFEIPKEYKKTASYSAGMTPEQMKKLMEEMQKRPRGQ